jgi:hypothetical protein
VPYLRTNDEAMQFLLGKLTEEERCALEDRLFADDDLFDRVVMAEADLVDAYARGELSSEDRECLEAGLLATPAGRERLAFARALDARARRARVEPRPEQTPAWGGLGAWLFARRGWVAGAAAATLAVAAASAWYFSRPGEVAPESTEIVAEDRSPAPEAVPSEPPPLVPTPPPSNDVETPTRPPSRSPSRARVAAFQFAPQTVRTIEELRVIRVPSDADTVRLVLGLEEPERSRYSAVLKTAAGEPVLRRDSLPVRGDGPRRRVVLDLPVDRLPPEEYVVALTEPDDESHVVADYIFRVERQ